MTERLDPAGRPTGRHAGITPALRIEPGLSVLQVGATGGAVSEALVSHGAKLLVLEADPVVARAVARRLVHEGSGAVVNSSLATWLTEMDPSAVAFDMLIYLEPPHEGQDPTAGMDEVLERSETLLRGSGVLVLAASNRWALSAQLRGRDNSSGHSPLSLAGTLRRAGLDQQRWLLPYPDHHRPSTIVDARLLDDRDGRSIVRAMVREPVVPAGTEPYLVPPMQAFSAALETGLAAAVADSVVLVAARQRQALEDRCRDGVLWTVPEPGLEPAWQRPRELLDVGGRRLWHALDSYRTQTSGPVMLGPATVAALTGASGEDLIVETLRSDGAFTPESREVLSQWWRAASTAIATAEPGRRPLDVRPRHFIVSADGDWRYLPQDLLLRFAIPAETLAFAGLADTIADALLRNAWPRGLRPGSTVGQAARAMLNDIGLRCDEATEFLWSETAADIMVRTSVGVDRDQARRRMADRLGARLDSALSSMPLSELLAAGTRLPEAEARIRELEDELRHQRSEIEAIRDVTARTPTVPDVSETDRRLARHIPGGEYVPLFDSDTDYRAAVLELEPWRTALEEIMWREAIEIDDAIEVVSREAAPTFLLPPGHVVKLYIKRHEGFERHARAVKTLRLLERDASLGAPRIRGEGRLGDRGRYLLMPRVPGQVGDEVAASIGTSEMETFAAWMGTWLRRLRTLPLEATERREAWTDCTDVIGHLRRTAVGELEERRSLPAHLTAQLEEWLPSVDELIGFEADLTLVHGDFKPGHVMVEIDGGRVRPQGVIGFESSRVVPAIWDLSYAWAALRSEPDRVIDAFMREAAFPGFGDPGFPRVALAWAVLQRWDRAWSLPDIDRLTSLDELATRIYGRVNATASGRPAMVPPESGP